MHLSNYLCTKLTANSHSEAAAAAAASCMSQSDQQPHDLLSTHALSEQANPDPAQPHAVRFASVNQEIEPDSSHQYSTSEKEQQNAADSPDLETYHTKDEIRSLALNLQDTRLQESRLRHFAFEPVSLPPSRVCLFIPMQISCGNRGVPHRMAVLLISWQQDCAWFLFC